MPLGLARAAAAALVRRPRLWPVALAIYAGLVPRRWWRRPPYLPVPDRRWLAFRMETAYGDAAAIPAEADLLAFLAWVRGERARRRQAASLRLAEATVR